MEVEPDEWAADGWLGTRAQVPTAERKSYVRIVHRLRESGGQGVIGFVAVIGLFGTVVAVATPAYLGFQTRKADNEAKTGLAAAVWTADAYRQDHHGSYAGMDTVDLLKIDPRVAAAITISSARRKSYCLTSNVRGRAWSVSGPFKGEPEFTSNATCS